tara:strand:- start:9916 stop:10641 length:726 start_codon:yes stop_codon:yes gene_type:complete
MDFKEYLMTEGSTKTDKLQQNDKITVYHATTEHRLKEMMSGGIIDATKNISRQYNQGAERGLYVTDDLPTARKFGSTIIEFDALGKELYPTATFGTPRSLRQNKDMQQKVKDDYPKSFRPFTSYMLRNPTEPQAMFIGIIPVKKIKAIHQFNYGEKGQPLRKREVIDFFNPEDNYNWDINMSIHQIYKEFSEVIDVPIIKVEKILVKEYNKNERNFKIWLDAHDMPRKLKLRLISHLRNIK